jgi:hypothetical protein
MRLALAAVASAALVGAFVSAPARASSPAATPMPQLGKGQAASVRSVNLSQLPAVPQTAVRQAAPAPLGLDGRPAGANLPRRATQGHRTVSAPQAVLAANAPSAVGASFNASRESNSGLIPSDSNAAVGFSQIVETVNAQVSVFSKTGAVLCARRSLAAFTGNFTESLFDPRVQFDNLNNRYIMVISLAPLSSTATPAMYVAASQSSNACGGWFVFRVTFSGSGFQPGVFLDYPRLGQDRGAMLVSTNNFLGVTFVGARAFSIPKSALYAGSGFSFTAFAVDGSTEPVVVGGNPMQATSTTFWVSSLPGVGYHLFSMPSGGGTISLRATINAAFNAPSRRANQPGTNVTLDPLDGRIQWAPLQINNVIWFAHDLDDAGFPTVRYGAINTSTNTVAVAEAFHTNNSGGSDDINPSISAVDMGGGLYAVWVNWAYTVTGAGVAASATLNGGILSPGAVPNLIDTDLTLVSGSSTNEVDTNQCGTCARFGDYSSVANDPVPDTARCPAGTVTATAVTNQQYFDTNGQWVTRIARSNFCR